MQIIESDSDIVIEHITTPTTIDSPQSIVLVSDSAHSSTFSVFDTIAMYQDTLTTQWMDISHAQQTISLQLALACVCSVHAGNQVDSLSLTNFPTTTSSYFDNGYMGASLNSGFAIDSHAEHHHCSCGGHYHDGKCENCGKVKGND